MNRNKTAAALAASCRDTARVITDFSNKKEWFFLSLVIEELDLPVIKERFA